MNSHLKRHFQGTTKETTALPHRIFLSLQTYSASQILMSVQNLSPEDTWDSWQCFINMGQVEIKGAIQKL